MKYFKQHDTQDCGIACLRTILYYNNIISTYPTLRECANISQNGTSMLDMIKTSNLYGLDAYGLKGTLESFVEEINVKEITLPIIAHIIKKDGMQHYIIVKDSLKKGFLIFDPADGEKKLTFMEFQQQWTGYIISFGNKREPEIVETSKQKYKLYTEIFNDYKWYYFSVTIALIMTSLVSLLIPFIFKELVDSSLTDEHSFLSHLTIVQKIMLFVGIILVQFLINVFSAKKIEKNTIEMNDKIATKYFKTLLYLPLNFFRNRNTGDILSRLTDLNDVVTYLSFVVPSLISDLITCVVVGIILYQINTTLFGIVAVVVCVYLLIVTLYKNKIKYSHSKVRKGSASLNSKLKEFVDGMETIKSLSEERNVLKRLTDENSSLMLNNYKLQMHFAYLNSKIMSLELIGLLILLFVGIDLVSQELITIGTLIMFESLFYLFITPVKNIIDNVSSLIKFSNSVDRLSDILESAIEKESLTLTKNIYNELKYDRISLSNVNFSYNSNTKIIENMNLELMRGINYGIIGNSGSGKSTLMKLITSLEIQKEGQIFIDNIQIENIPFSFLRKNILYVPQSMSLFNTTLKDNLLIGNSNVNTDLFDEIMDGCHIHTVMNELNIDLEYIVSENGWNFSGGQRQLIAIARALINEPKFIIFDESFNQLNNGLAQDILRFIDAKFKHITIIQVTHDNSILNFTDEVLTIGT